MGLRYYYFRFRYSRADVDDETSILERADSPAVWKTCFGGSVYVSELLTVKNSQLKTSLYCQVTGGSSGIGKAVAIEAAKLGAHVTILARDVHKLTLALDEIGQNKLVATQKINQISSKSLANILPYLQISHFNYSSCNLL